jgi:hypothetical protein
MFKRNQVLKQVVLARCQTKEEDHSMSLFIHSSETVHQIILKAKNQGNSPAH